MIQPDPDDRRPVARLWHCPPGTKVSLAKWDKDARKWIPERLRTIDHIQGRHAVMQDGLIVTLCHPVGPASMTFTSDGWRPLSTPTVNSPVNNLGTDVATHCSASEYELLVTE